jgi:ABC-type bacteriocin/lantibiotic exporter with double-glycine peptidase domain
MCRRFLPCLCLALVVGVFTATNLTLATAPTLDGEDVPDACGPIACYLALRSLGVFASLEDVLEQCNWHSGEGVQIRQMVEALADYSDVVSRPVHLTSGELFDIVEKPDSVAIVPLSVADDNHHAMVAVATRDSLLILIGYPELRRLVTEDELNDAWDGAAIVMYRDQGHDRHNHRSIWLVLVGIGGCVVLSALAGMVVRGIHLCTSNYDKGKVHDTRVD